MKADAAIGWRYFWNAAQQSWAFRLGFFLAWLTAGLLGRLLAAPFEWLLWRG